MPNRIIKESICTSDTIDNLEAAANAETFFYRLLVNCDDYGRMDARPAILRAKTYPLRVDKLKLSEIENWLKKLSGVGLIVIYDNNGRNYLQMPTWENHQQVRANKSKFPGIDDEGSILISNDIMCNQKKMKTNIAGDINCDQVISDSLVIDIRNRNTIYDNRHTNTKIKFAEFVTMTEEEHQKLIKQFGESGTNERIENLNFYKGSKGVKYKSDYMTILSWERKNNKKEQSEPEIDPGRERARQLREEYDATDI